MKVKIRKWKSMKKEFGLDDQGKIKTSKNFVKSMKHLCGKKVNVTLDFFGNWETDDGWSISSDMVTNKHKHKLIMKDNILIAGTWCWFYNNSHDEPFFGQLIRIEDQYFVTTNYGCEKYYNHCEQFKGQLPSIIKETSENIYNNTN